MTGSRFICAVLSWGAGILIFCLFGRAGDTTRCMPLTWEECPRMQAMLTVVAEGLWWPGHCLAESASGPLPRFPALFFPVQITLTLYPSPDRRLGLSEVD